MEEIRRRRRFWLLALVLVPHDFSISSLGIIIKKSANSLYTFLRFIMCLCQKAAAMFRGRRKTAKCGRHMERCLAFLLLLILRRDVDRQLLITLIYTIIYVHKFTWRISAWANPIHYFGKVSEGNVDIKESTRPSGTFSATPSRPFGQTGRIASVWMDGHREKKLVATPNGAKKLKRWGEWRTGIQSLNL